MLYPNLQHVVRMSRTLCTGSYKLIFIDDLCFYKIDNIMD
jgi:hypothetical protein